VSHIDQTLDSTLSKGQHGVRRSELEFTEECNRWNTREFANERRHTCRALAGTAHGDEYSVDLLCLQVVDYVVDALSMQRPIASFPGSVDAQALLRSE
jgi:hypothetical protein